MTDFALLPIASVLVDISRSMQEKKLICSTSGVGYQTVLTVGNNLSRVRNILNLLTLEDRNNNNLHWHRQPRSCRNICKRIQGSTVGVGNLGYNGRKRCVKCERYFLATKEGIEFCRCCGSQLRNKPKRPSRRSFEAVGD
jgi:hypothetical protein